MKICLKLWLAVLILALSLPLAQAESRAYTWQEALQETLYRNPSIRSAQANLEAARGTRLIFRARALPRVEVNAPVGYRGRRGSDTATGFVYADLSLNQPLFDYGIPASLRRADLDSVLAIHNLAQVTIEQLHAARLSFIYALAARESLEVLQVHAGRLNQNVSSQEARFKAGFVSIREVKEAQRSAENLRAQINAARQLYEESLTQLCSLMGRDQNSSDTQGPDVLLAGHLEFPLFEFNLSAEIESALAHRPDLATLRQLVLRTRTDATIAESGLYPVLMLTGGGRYVPTDSYKTDAQSLRNSSLKTEYRAGVNLSWRALDFGTTRGPVLRQNKLADSYDILRVRLENSIPLEITGIRNSYQNARTHQEQFENIRKSALEALGLINNQIEGGETPSLNASTQLDFSFAQNDFLQIELGVIQARAEGLRAAAELDRATGRYVTPNLTSD